MLLVPCLAAASTGLARVAGDPRGNESLLAIALVFASLPLLVLSLAMEYIDRPLSGPQSTPPELMK
jgi:hypothetical protein